MKSIREIMDAPVDHLNADEMRMGVAHIEDMLLRYKTKRRDFLKEQCRRGIPTTKGTIQ